LQKKGVQRAIALAPNYQVARIIAGFKAEFRGEIVDKSILPETMR